MQEDEHSGKRLDLGTVTVVRDMATSEWAEFYATISTPPSVALSVIECGMPQAQWPPDPDQVSRFLGAALEPVLTSGGLPIAEIRLSIERYNEVHRRRGFWAVQAGNTRVSPTWGEPVAEAAERLGESLVMAGVLLHRTPEDVIAAISHTRVRFPPEFDYTAAFVFGVEHLNLRDVVQSLVARHELLNSGYLIFPLVRVLVEMSAPLGCSVGRVWEQDEYSFDLIGPSDVLLNGE